ncbi:predicted protein [Naegleria gruberi]|uniref:Predicted protein n=1 Tax=Naegleria gruberi TaxID=5762 RepID=D2VWS1_NAEGR|nr:uncharacterized protein NAEGRDRAFT_73482 [Naegleria gruberi]EFC38672.1 predicted protein [Naegleria gruberi]|eukprot:XP_002671416.1 predicted protein [Naegleria gruberi strain NEG-M]
MSSEITTSNNKSSILITGATGTIGKHLLKSLSEQKSFGQSVKVLVRNIEKAKQELANYVNNLDVEYIQGDLNQFELIPSSIFEKIERVFVLTVSEPNQPKVEEQLINKILEYSKDDLKQVIRLSGLGASTTIESNSLFRYHGDSEVVIGNLLSNKAPSVSYVILRPNLFMQNFLRDDIHSIKNSSQFFKPRNDHGIPYHISHVDVRDIADMAAQILIENPNIHGGQVYNITGPQSLNYDQVAEIISKVIGRQITWTKIDEIELANQLSQLPKFLVIGLVRLFQFYKLNGTSANVHADFEIVTGKKPRSLEQFIQENKHHFE